MIIVGHRGARNEAPENTVEGFIHAQQNGCAHFELDIQLSADHELMVFHDSSLKRTTGIRKKLTSCESEFLQNLDARLNTPGWPGPTFIPTLEAVLDASPHVKHWQFEIKPDSRTRMSIIAHRLKQLIERRGIKDIVTITSSSRWFLQYLKESSHIQSSTGLVAEWPVPEPVRTAQKLSCEYLCIHHRMVNAALIERAHAVGLHVSTWTVNQPEQIRLFQALGVDSLITDNPTLALTR